ncbi:LptA/OstA family protein [Fodinicurvata sediminis]|uniref:LptA/OstA family protein n=1 Tax=Fodinicurvata sediminis TaxID=1121832 RepID=UPI0003B320D9|nr:LptA/OstA family protein [Fodinicurvata sediminis]
MSLRLFLAGGLLASAMLLTSFAAAQEMNVEQGDSTIQVRASDGIEWHRDRQVYIAIGDAVAVREDLTVYADRLLAHYRSEEDREDIYKVEAVGQVRIVTENDEEIFGDHAIYLLEEGALEVTGDDLLYESAEEKVTAEDSLEYYENAEAEGPMAIARGNAFVDRANGDQIRGDVITARFRENDAGDSEMYETESVGNVEVENDRVFASGNQGIYYAHDETATLEGNVKITRGNNQLNGDRAEIDLRSGVSRLLSTEGQGVSGLISPNDDEDSGSTGDSSNAPESQ